MPLLELVVIGKDPTHRWRRHIPDAQTIRLGRAPASGWSVPWDRCISREHCDLELQGDGVQVQCLERARNPVFYHGHYLRECFVPAGDEFKIGETLFQVNSIEFATMDAEPIEERTFDSKDVQHYEFDDADNRLEVLARLPEMIARAMSDESLARSLVRLLLAGIPHADAAAVVHYNMTAGLDTTRPLALQWDGQPHFAGRFIPSRRLIMAAIDARATKLHIWLDQPDSEGAENYTFSANLDWAFCTPIAEQASHGWCMYVSGKISDRIRTADDLKADIRFTELLSQTTGAIRQVRMLERRHSEMSQFFSPAVVDAIASHAGTTEEKLKPRVLDTTVLFCDMRGFSRRAERSVHDLPDLLERCSKSLGVMTKNIFAFDGVVADFQGDAALGFWGWPFEPDDGPLQACRAALKILFDFAKAREDPEDDALEDFHVGIGIAHGEAIAGKIGTEEQAKVGVFGPVVNLGSRLEGMTKYLRVPILIDETTADVVREKMPRASARCRRLGRILPYGLETPLVVSQLLPPLSVDATISDADIVNFEKAVDATTSGDWSLAMDILDELPVYDRAKDFLLAEMARHGYAPPDDWDGIIRMDSK